MRVLRPFALFATVAAALVATAGPAVAAPPANDDWQGAYELTAPDYYIQDTQEATLGVEDLGLTEGACAWGMESKGTVWYKYTAPATATLDIDPSFSDYPVNLVVVTREGDAWGVPHCFSGKARIGVEAGTTYHVLAAAAPGSNAGSLQLATSTFPAWVDVHENAEFTRRAAVVTHGALTCEAGVSYRLEVTAKQYPAGSDDIVGKRATAGTCTGSEQPWTVPVRASRGRFAIDNSTEVFVTLTTCSPTCGTATSRAYVTLFPA
jgi:hypothetical protein